MPLRARKKVLSGHPRQVDFPAGQVTFHSYLPNRQRPRQVVCQGKKKLHQDLPRASLNSSPGLFGRKLLFLKAFGCFQRYLTEGGVRGVRKPQNRTKIRQKTANRIRFLPEYRNRTYMETTIRKLTSARLVIYSDNIVL